MGAYEACRGSVLPYLNSVRLSKICVPCAVNRDVSKGIAELVLRQEYEGPKMQARCRMRSQGELYSQSKCDWMVLMCCPPRCSQVDWRVFCATSRCFKEAFPYSFRFYASFSKVSQVQMTGLDILVNASRGWSLERMCSDSVKDSCFWGTSTGM